MLSPRSNVVFKLLNKGDLPHFRELVALFHAVFEAENSGFAEDAHLLRLLGNQQFTAFVAFDHTEIIGGITAYELPVYYQEGSERFIYDIAVKPEYQ